MDHVGRILGGAKCPGLQRIRSLVVEGRSGAESFVRDRMASQCTPLPLFDQLVADAASGVAGLITIDNMFMGGRALDPQKDEPGPRVVHALTRKIFADERVEPSLVPIGDGLLVASQRA